jgi:peroxiredoxin
MSDAIKGSRRVGYGSASAIGDSSDPSGSYRGRPGPSHLAATATRKVAISLNPPLTTTGLLSDKKNNKNGGRTKKSSPSILGSGTKAPDFTLNATPDQTISLRDFRGKPVVLAFYPADWSPVCSDEMGLYAQVMPEFKKYDAEIIGISVDGTWCHLAFSKDRKLGFPLLADFEPKGAVSKAYGAFEERTGESARALFVIWSELYPDGVNPGADGIISALEKLYGAK